MKFFFPLSFRLWVILFGVMVVFLVFSLPLAAQPGKQAGLFNGRDADGKPLNAHGAGVLYYKGTYYLFGEVKKRKTWLVPGQKWEDYRVPAGGVSCYSSTDLKHWKYRGLALAPVRNDHSSDLDTSRVIERPKVIYNEQTGKFVMWMHVDKKDYSYSQAGVAISHEPFGPYTYLGSVKPNRQMVRDLTLFKDDDGKAYLIYASEDNHTLHVCLLNRDYLVPTESYAKVLVGKKREAPAVFKRNGKYYLVTSGCTGWLPNAASYAVADHIIGPWKEMGNPCQGIGAKTTFQAQGTFILPVAGSSQYIFMADKWNKLDLARSGYLWLPIRWVNGRMLISNH
jgi:hypothetical protein